MIPVYLDIELRAQVVGMRKAGLSFQAIAAHSNLPLSTVYKTIQRFNLQGTFKTASKTGLPTKMNECDCRELSRVITRHCRLTVAQVTNMLTTQVSTRTVQ
ncbi:hypothetical protein O181_103986 [Austropuccinia psidii MF-1]|uniref:Paired domain-containing protein n=1 Tax=Austropuccinia psidii MF-1 TaxID=1389203 RepID=A0A9Q3JLE2_9BASI|nr:hypothetical protein [Austropuccinia psidii MF-1]